MSAIFGRINFDGRPAEEDDLQAMEAVMNHWHADSKGITVDGIAGMGQLMLYNTPGSFHEKLPLKLDGLTITAVARIDNRPDICRTLGVNDDETATPDSTLILLLYRKYGENCVHHLIGDFAFAIYDAPEQKLFCARDHMGVKPFFYAHTSGYFAFASEKKGILVIDGFDKSLNEVFLYKRIMGDINQLPTDTLYINIKRLAAAHYLSLNIATGACKIHRYWTLDANTELKYSDKKDYYHGLRHHFDEAVKCRLRSKFVPGVELSGGLDSSAITGAAQRYSQNGLMTFSHTLAPDATDEYELRMSERKYIEDVIRFLHIRDAVIISDDPWESVLEEVDKEITINDGLEVWNPYIQLTLKQAVRDQNVRVLLSGFPGDEMVTYKGQHHYLELLQNKQYVQYVRNVRNLKSLRLRILPFVPHSASFAMHKLMNLAKAVIANKHKDSVFEIPLKYLLTENDNIWHSDHYRKRYKSYRHFQIARLIKPQVELRMESETRHGLYYRHEQRFPMADIRLTQYYLSIPNELKSNVIIDRHLYREAIKDYIPDSVYKRIKTQGRMAPFLSTSDRISRKSQVAYEILLSLKQQNDLPVRLKNVKPGNFFPLDLLRWCQKLSFQDKGHNVNKI